MKTTLTITAAASLLTGLVIANMASATREAPKPTQAIKATTVALDINDIHLPDLYIAQTLELKSGTTLANMLLDEGFSAGEVYAAANSLNKTFNLRRLRPGQELTVQYPLPVGSVEPELGELQLFDNADRYIKVAKDSAGYKTSVSDRELIAKPLVAKGTIDDSLYMSASKAGIPDQLIIPFVELFGWDIDFTRDFRQGDGFKLKFEALYDQEGKFVRYGNILGAELDLRRAGVQQAFRADNGEYYDAQGHSKRKTLLRTPIKFGRISSHFNPHRKHPILGYTRAHKGTDFAAPTGTPIKAAGNGRIVKLGWNGGYGRYIKIQHNGTFQTAYAHMHRYGSGLKQGDYVKQGDVIGYVGTSGRSTGPHLHYEVLRHGRHVNAMTVKLPNGSPLPKSEMANFKKDVASILTAWADTPTRMAANFNRPESRF